MPQKHANRLAYSADPDQNSLVGEGKSGYKLFSQPQNLREIMVFKTALRKYVQALHKFIYLKNPDQPLALHL